VKVIRNKLIPFGKHYYAINLFGVVFAKCRMSPQELNHEYIHTLQQRELLFLGFYIIYIMEWLARLILHRNLFQAYMHISFEQEAYSKMSDLQYAMHRKPFAWRKYLYPRKKSTNTRQNFDK